MKNPLLGIIERRKSGLHAGIPSYCTANELAIEAVLEQGLRFDSPILIEGTANQINQFGGYTGMKPADFRDYVYAIADKVGFDRERIILGGDHMGPLVWSNLPEKDAMANSKELLRQCVLAGFTKIHLDTSMKVADDPVNERLSDDVIAERGATLLEVCEATYQELLKAKPDAMRPAYIIGSEVPIPGGAQEEDAGLQVTGVKDFEATLETYHRKFTEHGIADRWQDVIAVVVQPGVEFGDKDIHQYDRQAARELSAALKKHPNVVFEGHSTDYQPPAKLREMVEDGIAIIKVGPALTNAVREAIFALSMIEAELIPDKRSRANFIDVLEKEMLKNDKDWKKHYHGTELEQHIARKYSFSDRSRYYFSHPPVVKAQEKLFKNFEGVEIPLPLLHQYMPLQYTKVRDGKLKNDAHELVKDAVVCVVEDYNFAVKTNYMVHSMF